MLTLLVICCGPQFWVARVSYYGWMIMWCSRERFNQKFYIFISSPHPAPKCARPKSLAGQSKFMNESLLHLWRDNSHHQIISNVKVFCDHRCMAACIGLCGTGQNFSRWIVWFCLFSFKNRQPWPFVILLPCSLVSRYLTVFLAWVSAWNRTFPYTLPWEKHWIVIFRARVTLSYVQVLAPVVRGLP